MLLCELVMSLLTASHVMSVSVGGAAALVVLLVLWSGRLLRDIITGAPTPARRLSLINSKVETVNCINNLSNYATAIYGRLLVCWRFGNRCRLPRDDFCSPRDVEQQVITDARNLIGRNRRLCLSASACLVFSSDVYCALHSTVTFSVDHLGTITWLIEMAWTLTRAGKNLGFWKKVFLGF